MESAIVNKENQSSSTTDADINDLAQKLTAFSIGKKPMENNAKPSKTEQHETAIRPVDRKENVNASKTETDEKSLKAVSKSKFNATLNKPVRKPLTNVTNIHAAQHNQSVAEPNEKPMTKQSFSSYMDNNNGTRRRPPIPHRFDASVQSLQSMQSRSMEHSQSVEDTASISSSVLSSSKAAIDKFALDPQYFTRDAWTRYSEQMALAHSPYIVWDAPYALCSFSQFATPFDLLLKVWYQSPFDSKKHFKIYCVHKQYAVDDKHSSRVLHDVVNQRDNTVDIDVQVQDVCADAMGHVIVYMYTGHVTVTCKDLIPLYTLVERLRMKGDIQKQLLINIRNQYNANDNVLVPYIAQAQSVEAHQIKNEIYTVITRKAINDRKDLSDLGLQRLSLPLFQELFKYAVQVCKESNSEHCPYHIVIDYLFHTKLADPSLARMVLETVVKMKEFDANKCSVSQCIEFVKIMDVLFGESADCIKFYKTCFKKAQFEFNPFDPDDSEALHDLLPRTFNELLVNALHLQKSCIEVALLKYKELNHQTFRHQLKAFNYTTIWNQRLQIYGQELLNVQQPTFVKSKVLKKAIPDNPAVLNQKSGPPSTSSSSLHHKASRSPTPLSGTDNNENEQQNFHILIVNDDPSPPLLRTPPSPPKSHNECYSPMARRVPPKLTYNASTASLLEQQQIAAPTDEQDDDDIYDADCHATPVATTKRSSLPLPTQSLQFHIKSPNSFRRFTELTTDILDAAIASVERENLRHINDSDGNESENPDELTQPNIDALIETKYFKNTQVGIFNRTLYTSPENMIENRARDTLSFKRRAESRSVSRSNSTTPRGPASASSHSFTPEKLVFRSRPGTPESGTVLATYKAPKINKGCLVETIDKYHSGVAKLSPIKQRTNDEEYESSPSKGNILESRVFRTRASPKEADDKENSYKTHTSPSKRFGPYRSDHGVGVGVVGSTAETATSGGSRNNSLSPSKRRGSGGAYCVECNQWRHKFDFTKSQWRNRPRGFRRCKFCTGEIGSDSKPAPNEWSPRRYRMKSHQMK